ncbi:MAG: hypothetical protein WAZ19_09070 [Anaerolineae bacterium]
MSIRLRGFDQINQNIPVYADRLKAGIFIICREWARIAQDYARQNRPWQDRTGNARQGLDFYPVQTDKGITIYLTTQMEYGVQLEVRRGGRYSIIMPTMTAKSPELASALKRLSK